MRSENLLPSILIIFFILSLIYLGLDISTGVLLLLLYIVVEHEVEESYKYYDYAKDYNSARVSGKLIAGTVYASYPDNVPGLGWIN